MHPHLTSRILSKFVCVCACACACVRAYTHVCVCSCADTCVHIQMCHRYPFKLTGIERGAVTSTVRWTAFTAWVHALSPIQTLNTATLSPWGKGNVIHRMQWYFKALIKVVISTITINHWLTRQLPRAVISSERWPTQTAVSVSAIGSVHWDAAPVVVAREVVVATGVGGNCITEWDNRQMRVGVCTLALHPAVLRQCKCVSTHACHSLHPSTHGCTCNGLPHSGSWWGRWSWRTHLTWKEHTGVTNICMYIQKYIVCIYTRTHRSKWYMYVIQNLLV